MNILNEIAEKTRERIEKDKIEMPREDLIREIQQKKVQMLLNPLIQSETAKTPHSFYQALKKPGMSYICEVKKASPSKGLIAPDFPYLEIAKEYKSAGASAISCLTEPFYFQGSDQYLWEIASEVDIPVLRKDFIVSPYQLYQAKLAGADVVLLIAAALTVDECKALGKLAHQLEMEVLLEIHTEKELDYLHEHVDLIGVNNRNLGTFHTDVENSFRLARKLPKELLWVSESGISQPDTFRQLREAGFRGFLMGETFMKTPSPEKALSDFLQALAL